MPTYNAYLQVHRHRYIGQKSKYFPTAFFFSVSRKVRGENIYDEKLSKFAILIIKRTLTEVFRRVLLRVVVHVGERQRELGRLRDALKQFGDDEDRQRAHVQRRQVTSASAPIIARRAAVSATELERGRAADVG